jgi:aldose 1-epimerase
MLRLAAGDLVCELAPALGGCIVSMRCGGVDVLRPAPADLKTARESSSYPLVPWSNRIGHGRMHWGGHTWTLAPNNAPEPHAIHGIGWQDAWQVQRASADEAELVLVHAADPRWSFDFESRQWLRVTPQALALELSVTNHSAASMPAGLGWHPFFVKRPGARIRARTTGRWEMSADKLPTGRSANDGLDRPCEGLDVDHCFDGWDGQAELQDSVMHVRISSSLRHLVVFTTPARDVIAIEPVSHLNNVYGDPAVAAHAEPRSGARTLAPRETLRAAATIAVSLRTGA